MGRISTAIKNYITQKHNLTVTVNEHEGIISMNKETFSEIITEYELLIYSNISYALLLVVSVIGFCFITIFM